MIHRRVLGLCSAVALVSGGCGLDTGGGIFGGSGAFIIRGTMTVADGDGPCLVFQAEDGYSYHLRQATGLPSVDFDALTEVGAISRLEVRLAEDLPVACGSATVVEVEALLELISADGSTDIPSQFDLTDLFGE
jgi:hypothetical protein